MRTRLHIILMLTLLWTTACASSGGGSDTATPETAPAPTTAAEHTEHSHEPHSGKLKAPLILSLTTSGATGRVTATLNLKATADIPDARVHFKVPQGIALAEGKLDQSLGELKAQESREVELILEVPTDKDLHAQLIAAVDCHMRPGLKLARSAIADLGAGTPATDGTQVIDGVRVQTVKPRK